MRCVSWSWGLVVVVACHSEPGGALSTSGAGGMDADSGAGATSPGETVVAGAAGDVGAQGIPIVPLDGWVEATHRLDLRGKLFANADTVTRETLEADFEGSNICIRGTAAKVDTGCVPVPPALDCFQQTFGAVVGFNLNQEPGGEPEPFDPTGIQQLTFDLVGPQLPLALHFSLDTPDGDSYCRRLVGVESGSEDESSTSHVVVLGSMPRGECSASSAGGETLGAAMPNLVRVRWTVTTNTRDEVPFDFCVQNLRAFTE